MPAGPDGGRLREGPEWAEYKLDGYRACLRAASDGVLTEVLAGEIVVYHDAGQSDFGLLRERRGRYQTHRSSARRDEPFDDVPVRFLAFGLPHLDGTSLLREPYDERRRLTLLPMPDPYRVEVMRAALPWCDLTPSTPGGRSARRPGRIPANASDGVGRAD
ncbi:hypothetical protein [Amycolatopsis lurida]|uniref:ATP-dependent DNA ligase family profile domain-containing protein n=1 Tax=Amycolatopsis lurida NRRL 2430 TaxID=1460371 RepID=A0A2P2FU58_AMYLU|nr:hypothetical protein [Amycolatopsis lurida]KFU80229.1 hypothetical protein BB31_15475 [Amycolatopsis lurida NRRL 2430]